MAKTLNDLIEKAFSIKINIFIMSQWIEKLLQYIRS